MSDKISVHPLIDNKLDKDFHFDYSAFHEFLSIDDTIRQLHKMSMPPRFEPLVVSRQENSLSAQEIVSSKFVAKACENITNVNVMLTVALRKAMSDAGFTEGTRVFLFFGVCVCMYVLSSAWQLEEYFRARCF